jgi:hypothetical protein
VQRRSWGGGVGNYGIFPMLLDPTCKLGGLERTDKETVGLEVWRLGAMYVNSISRVPGQNASVAKRIGTYWIQNVSGTKCID